MRVKFDAENIYIISREYSGYHMKTVDVENRITLGEAIRLRSELDAAICASQPSSPADGIFDPVCRKCGDPLTTEEFICDNCRR